MTEICGYSTGKFLPGTLSADEVPENRREEASCMFRSGSSKLLRAVSVAIVAFVLGFLSACQTPGAIKSTGPETVVVPDEARLRARLVEFHNALGANDIERRYAMSAPAIREKMTLEQFKKDMRWNENAARMKMTAALGRACGCVPMQYLRCVLIVDVTVEEAGGKITKEQPLEMWEYDGSEWYGGYIGANSRGRCPGER